MLDRTQFQPNDAWIVFRLNETPVRTMADGDFNVVCLMDASSGYILGSEFVPTHLPGAPEAVALRLLDEARDKSGRYPAKLLLSDDEESGHFAAVAAASGIDVRHVADRQLLPFIREARDGFREHIGSRG